MVYHSAVLMELPNFRAVAGISDHGSLLVLLVIKGPPTSRHSGTLPFMTFSIFKLEISIYSATTGRVQEALTQYCLCKNIVKIKFTLIS